MRYECMLQIYVKSINCNNYQQKKALNGISQYPPSPRLEENELY